MNNRYIKRQIKYNVDICTSIIHIDTHIIYIHICTVTCWGQAPELVGSRSCSSLRRAGEDLLRRPGRAVGQPGFELVGFRATQKGKEG